MNTVTIDIGNGSAKADFWDNDGFMFRKSGGAFDIDSIVDLGKNIDVGGYIVSTVRRDSEDIIRELEEKSGCLVVRFDFQEIKRHYDISFYKGNLGPDRMAAVLGSNVVYPGIPKMVVDIGTAMTIDVVDASGNFKGGNISLGLMSRMKALAAATSKLPAVEEMKKYEDFGTDTEMAISSGARNGVVGEILYSFEKAKREYGVRLGVLTGGDAEKIYFYLSRELGGLLDPYLVGRGLDYHLRVHHLHVPVGRIQI